MAAITIKLPDADKTFPAWVMALGLVVAAGASPLQAILIERGERKKRQLLQQQDDVRVYLASGLIAIVEKTGLDWKKVGLHAFVVKGRFRPRHQRLSKVKLKAAPSSRISWTKGKGVIGKCWETARPTTLDLRDYYAPYLNHQQAQWDALAPGARLGLSFPEFERTRADYGVVSAVPIFDSKEKYCGCVSMDAPHNCAKGLDHKEIEEILLSTASLLQIFLAEKK